MAVVHEVNSWVHNQVHRGKMRSLSHVFDSVSDAASVGLALKSGDEDLHTFFVVTSGGSARYRLYEDPTMTASTVKVIYDMNREVANTAEASAGHTPTFTVGTVIFEGHIPGGGKQAGGGGTARSGTEWILDTDSTYIFAASNLQGATTAISFDIEFYEH